MEKSRSSVCMTLTSGSAWLNGCLQPQHYYVTIDITDPEGKSLARVALSYEQAAKMLLYNGHVECTLQRYRDATGKTAVEKVEPPENVHKRMKRRLSETHKALLERIEDVRLSLHDMVNGDKKANKTTILNLLQEMDTIQNHFLENQSFILQQSEEELSSMQNNAAGQLSLFLQTKGFEPTQTYKNDHK